jgi:hypothetical protein
MKVPGSSNCLHRLFTHRSLCGNLPFCFRSLWNYFIPLLISHPLFLLYHFPYFLLSGLCFSPYFDSFDPHGLLSPFCGITKEMMSRGPQVAVLEYRETTLLAVSTCTYGSLLYHHSLDPSSSHPPHQLASGRQMGLAPCSTSQVLWKVITLVFEAFKHVVLKLLLIIECLLGQYAFDHVSPW